jgi:hypothetical protein
VHASAAPPVVATRPDEPVESAAAPEVPGEFDRPGAGARQDFEGQRPVAPGIDDGKPKPWLWIAAAVALGVVLAVAGAAILMRQKPQDLAIKPPVEATAPPAPQPPAKIAERVEATPANPAAPAATASAPKADQSAAQGAAPAAPAAETQSPPAASAAAAPSAGRAAMLVASADNPQKPVVSLGSTVWSLIPAAPGQPATVAVKAEADIPDLKMHATMTLRKNTDPTLQATHTIDLKFSFADGAPITGFKDVGLPQMRQGQDQRHLFPYCAGQGRFRHRPQPRPDADARLVRLPAAAQRRPHRQGRVPEIRRRTGDAGEGVRRVEVSSGAIRAG